MNVAVLSSIHPALDGRIFFKESVSLVRAGFSVTLIAPFDPDATDISNGNGICYKPLRARGSRSARPVQWFLLLRYLLKNKYDVWHFHDPELLPQAVIWKRLFARKVILIYDVHEDMPKSVLNREWIPSRLRKLVSRLTYHIENWGIRNCDLTVAATDSIACRVSVASEKVVIVRNYPILNQEQINSLNSSRSKRQRKEIQIIFIGPLGEQRGVSKMVEAMREINNPDIRLLLLGTFFPPTLQDEILNSAPSNVIYGGQIPFEQVPEYLANSDIGIVCYMPTDNYLDSLPTKLFEYMREGLPTIASNFWKELVEGNGVGVCVDPENPKEIAEAILYLSMNKDIREKMGMTGTRLIQQKYNWQVESETLVQAYKNFSNYEYL